MISFKPDNQAPRDRRGSYRYTVSGPRRDAQLRIGTRQFVAEILDESANGFSILLAENPGCDIGQTALLKVAAGWTETRVMNIQTQGEIAAPLASPPTEEPSEAPIEQPDRAAREVCTRLGLMRLRDLETEEVEPAPVRWNSWQTLRALLTHLSPLARPLTGLLAFVIGAPLIALALVWMLDHSLAGDDGGDGPQLRLKSPGDNARAARAERATPAPEPPRPARHRYIKFDILAKKSANTFSVKKKVTRLLSLNKKQLQELQGVFDDYQKAIDRAILGDPNSTNASRNEQLDIQLGRRGLSLLTDEQQASLLRLLSRPESLIEPEIKQALALSREQLTQLRQIFDTSATNETKTASSSDPGAPAASSPDAQLSRRGMAVLTGKQRGSLIRLLSQTDLGQDAKPAQP